jgi:hypothetical protein
VEGFPEVVADARRRGCYISIGTNGVYTDAQLEWLPFCPLIGSSFPWTATVTPTTSSAVRALMIVLSTLSLAKGPAKRVRLNMVVARHDLSSIEAVARVAAEHQATSLTFAIRAAGQRFLDPIEA